MLNGYTAISRKDFNVPLHLVPGLQEACGDYALAQWLTERSGGSFVQGLDFEALQLGRFVASLDQIEGSIRALEVIRQAQAKLMKEN